jgi:ketosteroid isomerase-like protein
LNACNLKPSAFLQVLQSYVLFIERINAKQIQDLSLGYTDDATIEVNGFSQFVGIEQIEGFWKVLFAELNQDLVVRDVEIHGIDENTVSLSARLSVGKGDVEGFSMRQIWVEGAKGWQVVSSKVTVEPELAEASDSFLEFIRNFSKNLQDRLTGRDITEANWSRLSSPWGDDMEIVLPDGTKYTGAEFRDHVYNLSSKFPDLEIDMSQVEVVSMSENLCVVYFVEYRRMTHEPSCNDVRSNLAFLKKSSQGWMWRHVQQTNMGPEVVNG